MLDHGGRRLIVASDTEAAVLDVSTGNVLQELPRGAGRPLLAVSAGAGTAWVCLATTTGHVVVAALDNTRQRWTCWLDSPLESIVAVDGARVVARDGSDRVLVLRLVPRRHP